MSEFENGTEQAGFRVKLWRGERMCLVGFDVKNSEPDLVGFAIECKSPGAGQAFEPLRNRLAFSYYRPAAEAVTGYRNFPSTENPVQKFWWVHFPHEPRTGKKGGSSRCASPTARSAWWTSRTWPPTRRSTRA